MLEVDDKPDRQTRDLQVVDDLAEFMVGDPFNDLCIHDNGVSNNDVGDVLANLHIFVPDIKTGLLLKSDASQTKLNHKCVLIRFFEQPMPQSNTSMAQPIIS